MTISVETNKALSRNESLATTLLGIVNSLPDYFPLKVDIQESLYSLRSAIHGLRPPRVMVIGACKAGKSSLINAICGLKVAEVSDTKPETGKAEWKEYHHNGTELLHILDTRGLRESEAPRQDDSAKTPYESIMKAVREECPDIILFVCKATEVHHDLSDELSTCETILAEIKRRYQRGLPIIGVLTKCDELAPPRVPLPTDNEKKNRNIQEQVQSFYGYLKEREGLRFHTKEVIPTVAYADYEDGDNGLILPEQDERWNITELVEAMIRCAPTETRGSLARMAHIEGFQLTVARTVVNSCSALCGFVSVNPIPGAAIPAVAVIQSFMVMYIAWLGGREFSEQSLKDFAVTTGVGVGANAGMIGIADVALKFLPGVGSLLSSGASAIATKGLGDSAVAYFLENDRN